MSSLKSREFKKISVKIVRMKSLIGSLIRDIGLGFFVNGLFTITQIGFSLNSIVVTLIAIKIIIYGILIQNEEQKQWDKR